MQPKIHVLLSITILLFSLGCTQVHHVQLSDFSPNERGRQIEILVREIGVNVEQAVRTAEKITAAFSRSNRRSKSSAADTVAMFQYGPKTGKPIYDKNFGNNLLTQLLQECPSGKLTDIESTRLAIEYADTGVSQESVRVRARCLK